jgi:hypothetical protein
MMAKTTNFRIPALTQAEALFILGEGPVPPSTKPERLALLLHFFSPLNPNCGEAHDRIKPIAAGDHLKASR